jgi:hypothetical protein
MKSTDLEKLLYDELQAVKAHYQAIMDDRRLAPAARSADPTGNLAPRRWGPLARMVFRSGHNRSGDAVRAGSERGEPALRRHRSSSARGRRAPTSRRMRACGTRSIRSPGARCVIPIFARAFVLSDGQTRVAFIGWDLVDAREYAVARVRRAVMAATGIPEDHIIVHATHNHSGPKSEMGPEPLAAFERKAALPAQQDPLYRPWVDQAGRNLRESRPRRRPQTAADHAVDRSRVSSARCCSTADPRSPTAPCRP